MFLAEESVKKLICLTTPMKIGGGVYQFYLSPLGELSKAFHRRWRDAAEGGQRKHRLVKKLNFPV